MSHNFDMHSEISETKLKFEKDSTSSFADLNFCDEFSMDSKDNIAENDFEYNYRNIEISNKDGDTTFFKKKTYMYQYDTKCLNFGNEMKDVCKSLTNETIPSLTTKNYIDDTTKDLVKKDFQRDLNYSVFNTLENDFSINYCDKTGITNDITSQPLSCFISDEGTSSVFYGSNSKPEAVEPISSVDLNFLNCSFDANQQNESKKLCLPPKKETNSASNLYMPSQDFDLDALLHSPAKSSKKYVPEDLLLPSSFSEDNFSYNDQQDTLSSETKKTNLKLFSKDSVNITNLSNYSSMKSNVKLSKNVRMKSLIRRVKYNLGEASSTNTSNSETICFATHPAGKAYSKRSYAKKIISKSSNSSKSPTKRRYEKSTDSISKKNISVNSVQGLSNPLILPVGQTGCSISIPSTTIVDINSFSTDAPNKILNTPKPLRSQFSINSKQPENYIYNSKNPIDKFPKPCYYAYNSMTGGSKAKNFGAYSVPGKKMSKSNGRMNLRNIVKIEIYTKPPQKMVITKCNSHQTNSNTEKIVEKDEDQSKQPTNLNTFIDLLRNSIKDLPDDLMKQLSLPIDAGQRSYLTSIEIMCLERQAHLLKSLKELKSVHPNCFMSSCTICKDIVVMQAELLELKTWKNNSLQSKILPISQSKLYGIKAAPKESSAEGAVDKYFSSKNKVECEKLIINQVNSNSMIILKPTPASTSKKEEDAEDNSSLNSNQNMEKENQTLSISDANEFIQKRPSESRDISIQYSHASCQSKNGLHKQKLTHMINTFMENRKGLQNQDRCACDDNCRSFLDCLCMREASACVGCPCRDTCQNPLKAFQFFSIHLRSLSLDQCLMQTIYNIPLDDLMILLNKEQIVPCCHQRVKMVLLVPSVVKCLHCHTFLSYSWCDRVIRNEKLHQRNHCVVCCKCRPPLLSHCYVCEDCTLTSATGMCVECDKKKLYAGISFG